MAQRGIRILKQAETNLPATTLIRDVYRTLIHTGRSYAAFTEKDITFLDRLRGVDEILDPMAGYGLLTQHSAKIGQRSYSVEFNLPQYFWQVLCHPAHAPEFIKCLRQIQAWQPRWPKATIHLSSKDAVRENYSELLEARVREIGLPLRPGLPATFEAEERWRARV